MLIAGTGNCCGEDGEVLGTTGHNKGMAAIWGWRNRKCSRLEYPGIHNNHHNNWHLLDYSQLAPCSAGMRKLAYTKEDDFLSVKQPYQTRHGAPYAKHPFHKINMTKKIRDNLIGQKNCRLESAPLIFQ